jgi:hypothetical protein
LVRELRTSLTGPRVDSPPRSPPVPHGSFMCAAAIAAVGPPHCSVAWESPACAWTTGVVWFPPGPAQFAMGASLIARERAQTPCRTEPHLRPYGPRPCSIQREHQEPIEAGECRIQAPAGAVSTEGAACQRRFRPGFCFHARLQVGSDAIALSTGALKRHDTAGCSVLPFQAGAWS